MPEAWDLVPTEERSAETVATFILFCEDKVSEPTYFHAFQREKKVKINFFEDQKSDQLNYVNTIQHCLREGLVEYTSGGYRIVPGTTEHLWCVYDRDAEFPTQAQLAHAHQIRFTTAIHQAQNAGLHVAWSNDVFELWILLHFEEVTVGQWLHRRVIYDRLTSIFRDLPGQSTDMMAVTQHPQFDYKDAMKGRNHFISFVRPLLPPRQAAAMERARILSAAFAAHTPYHERNPCTKIYELVEHIESFY